MSTMTVNGRLGRDAELRHTSDGTAYAPLNVAYNYGRRDGDGKRPTQWIQATLWGRQAEALIQYLEKGTGVVLTVEDVHIHEYQKNDGSTGSQLQGRVIKFEFGMNAPSSGSKTQSQPQQQAPAQQQQQQNYQAPNHQQHAPGPSLDQEDPPW